MQYKETNANWIVVVVVITITLLFWILSTLAKHNQ